MLCNNLGSNLDNDPEWIYHHSLQTVQPMVDTIISSLLLTPHLQSSAPSPPSYHEDISPKTPYNPLKTSFLQLVESNQRDCAKQIDWGFLIGILDKRNELSDMLPSDAHKINIDQKGELISPFYIRPYSLDALVVNWREEDYGSSLDKLIQIGQKLILVGQTLDQTKKLLNSIEKTLLHHFENCSLSQFADKLSYSYFQKEQKHIVVFHGKISFEETFWNNILNNCSFRGDRDSAARISQRLTIREYHRYLTVSSSRPSLKIKLQKLRNTIKEEDLQVRINNQNIDQQQSMTYEMDRINNNKQTIQSEDESQNEENIKYFNQLPIQSKLPRANQQEDQDYLFYFIQQREQSESSCQNDQFFEQQEKPKWERSKSQKTLLETTLIELDDQFYNKY